MASTPPLFQLHVFTQIAKDICDVLSVTGILNSGPNQITGTHGFLQKTAMLIFLSATTWAWAFRPTFIRDHSTFFFSCSNAALIFAAICV